MYNNNNNNNDNNNNDNNNNINNIIIIYVYIYIYIASAGTTLSDLPTQGKTDHVAQVVATAGRRSEAEAPYVLCQSLTFICENHR